MFFLRVVTASRWRAAIEERTQERIRDAAETLLRDLPFSVYEVTDEPDLKAVAVGFSLGRIDPRPLDYIELSPALVTEVGARVTNEAGDTPIARANEPLKDDPGGHEHVAYHTRWEQVLRRSLSGRRSPP